MCQMNQIRQDLATEKEAPDWGSAASPSASPLPARPRLLSAPGMATGVAVGPALVDRGSQPQALPIIDAPKERYGRDPDAGPIAGIETGWIIPGPRWL